MRPPLVSFGVLWFMPSFFLSFAELGCDFFAPVEFSPSRSLAEKYPAPLSSKIEFYERSAEGGKTFFAPVLTVQRDGVRDSVFAVSASGDGKFKSVCVDIGL